MTENAFYTRLKGRGRLKISGRDRISFLQGLISNDLGLLEQQPCVYSCLLTPQGKFLYDFFITKDDEALILDCEGGERLTALAKLLSFYKLRSDVQIATEDNVDTYSVFGDDIGVRDPRSEQMGTRIHQKPKDLKEKPFEIWDERRIRLYIPDGSRDMIPNQSTLLECRIDKHHGVSFDKGCYMGQELTARTHYRGLIKKHLYAIEADSLPDSGSEIKIDGRIVGEMRSSCGRIGLAMLKDEALDDIKASSQFVILNA
jgi:folate-binding protein YgfZ